MNISNSFLVLSINVVMSHLKVIWSCIKDLVDHSFGAENPFFMYLFYRPFDCRRNIFNILETFLYVNVLIACMLTMKQCYVYYLCTFHLT